MELFLKVCRIHRELPGGAILVFVTGEKEVTRLCKLLRKAFQKKEKVTSNQREDDESEKTIEVKEDNSPKKEKRKRKISEITTNDSFVALPPKIDLDE